MSQTEFKKNVIENLDAVNDVTLVSRPTTTRLKDYEGDNLIKCFPLQFPYGVGAMKKKKGKKEPTGRENIDHIKHLLSLSLPNMHRPEFILVTHNMYERHRAAEVSYLRCNYKSGGSSRAESFASMSVERLKSAVNRSNAHMAVNDAATLQFLNSIEAVSRSMGHTNEAAKQARTRMFSMIAKFGVPAVFFTVTPDDNGSFRIKVNACKESAGPPDINDALADIKLDADIAREIREQYPGLCDFDFENILDLVIKHLIGWDESTGVANDTGGAFGVADAWSAAIEEQGRKTLHAHFLIWIKDWSYLLERLRSVDKEGVRKAAGEELQLYADNIMSTKLHGNLPPQFRKKAFSHSCVNSDNETQEPVPCSLQDLRNLRYKDGVSSFGEKSIVKCDICGNGYTSESLVSNVVSSICHPCHDGSEEELRMSLAATIISKARE